MVHHFIANLGAQSMTIAKSINAVTDDNIPIQIRSKSYYLPGPAAEQLCASAGICPKSPIPQLDFDLGSHVLVETNPGRLAWLRHSACVGVSCWVGKREITDVYILLNFQRIEWPLTSVHEQPGGFFASTGSA